MRTDLKALPWLLPRPRVVGLLARRWEHRVVTIEAGAGFGKSTALALALAAAEDHGRLDHYVKLDETCTSGAALMRRLRQACGDAAPDVEDPAAFVHRLGERDEHCLIFDDVHQLGGSGAGVEALREIVDALPPTVHVVLSSRRRAPIPLARRRASGDVLDLGEPDLAYTDDELASIAELTDTPIQELAGTGGWPALVSLTVRQGHRGALEFLAEEILADLDAGTRDALMVASLAGGADPEVLRRVTGFDGDPRLVASRVPLVTIDANDVLVPHALWSGALQANMSPEARQQVLARLLEVHRSRGEHGAALQLALQLSDVEAIVEVVREVCAPGHIGFEVDDIDRWLGQAPASFHDRPEGRLLHALSACRRDPYGDATKQILEESVIELRAAGVVDCEIVALSELALVYRWRGEAHQIPVVIGRLFELEVAGNAAAEPLAAFARGAIADQMGDTAGALEAIRNLRRGDLHDSWIALVEFIRSHELLLLGRVREAYDAAVRSVALSPPGYAGGWCAERAMAWCLGVTRERIDRLPIADEVEGASVVDRIWIGSWFGAMQAFAGRLDAAGRNVAVAESALHTQSQPELSGFVAWARAALAVAEHDVATARAEVLDFFATHPVDSPVGIRFAARAPALVDLLVGDDLDPGWRDHIGGRWQQEMLAVADGLRALRSGEPVTERPDPAVVLRALPVPWAVEMAVRGHLVGAEGAIDIARLLVDVAGSDVVQTEIDRHLEPQHRPQARQLFGAGAAGESLRIRLLGPVKVMGDVDLQGSEELRRMRVRELLAYVALRGPVRREVVAEALWPDHDQKRSTANIRVNLSYLGRIRTGDGRRLVTETASGLALADGLTCDVYELEADVADAAAAQRAGYDTVAVRLYEKALEAIDGPPLVDTRRTEWFEHEADRLAIAVVRAAATGAALAVATELPMAAIGLARRAVELDPYHEEAWADLVRAHRMVGDEAAAASAATQMYKAASDLGIDLAPTTMELLEDLLPSGG